MQRNAIESCEDHIVEGLHRFDRDPGVQIVDTLRLPAVPLADRGPVRTDHQHHVLRLRHRAAAQVVGWSLPSIRGHQGGNQPPGNPGLRWRGTPPGSLQFRQQCRRDRRGQSAGHQEQASVLVLL